MFPDRLRRVEEQIQRELATLLDRDVRDPRIGMVSVTRVSVSRDLRQADVWISRLADDPEGERECQEGLEKARGFLRKSIGDRVRLKFTPDLRFHMDSGIREAAAMDHLFRQIEKEREEREATSDDENQ